MPMILLNSIPHFLKYPFHVKLDELDALKRGNVQQSYSISHK